jgi:hypothetical protein
LIPVDMPMSALLDQDDADATWMFDDRGLSWRPQAEGC